MPAGSTHMSVSAQAWLPRFPTATYPTKIADGFPFVSVTGRKTTSSCDSFLPGIVAP